ncbi:uncharacterized protein GGS25DRAFT_379916 [Hypoxylon fragiforme]|uniref:uncharacterized protein n=1 Tax=Hypoxylon fragiforme TaxID=63214 RepID=UPI0020C72ABB|nr:uncharacterized protein GGS25DRAFT_379916 [Hypoxylon fragiforme]KAI2606254.1 hypothetical protein GGS25DRAFT_379916 [Hypoxylon fragiforme]
MLSRIPSCMRLSPAWVGILFLSLERENGPQRPRYFGGKQDRPFIGPAGRFSARREPMVRNAPHASCSSLPHPSQLSAADTIATLLVHSLGCQQESSNARRVAVAFFFYYTPVALDAKVHFHVKAYCRREYLLVIFILVEYLPTIAHAPNKEEENSRCWTRTRTEERDPSDIHNSYESDRRVLPNSSSQDLTSGPGQPPSTALTWVLARIRGGSRGLNNKCGTRGKKKRTRACGRLDKHSSTRPSYTVQKFYIWHMESPTYYTIHSRAKRVRLPCLARVWQPS